MTESITRLAAAHRAIDIMIDNAPDELHDRARDDAAAIIEPHLDALRALMHAAAKQLITTDNDFRRPDADRTPHTDLDDAATTLLDYNDDDFAPLHDAISTLLYAPYPDQY